jgi:HAMP domain-containing protein
MPLLMMVKAKWTLFGIEAPQFIWIAAAVLLVGTLWQVVRLWWRVSGEKTLYRHIMTQLEAIRLEYGVRRQEGLAQAAYDAVVQVFDAHPPLAPAWHNFETQMLGQSNTEGQQRLWATESAASAFNATTVIEPRLNQSFFAAVPGMVTGIGLLCTFVAILVALLDVRLVEGQFQGLDNLISGLSGKFLSSIAALFAATCFLAIERSLSHGLGTSLHDLAMMLDRLVPRLSPTSILLVMQRDMAEQSTALQLFNTHFDTRLQQGIREGVGPVLERLATILQELTHRLHTTEADQQETLANTFRGLVQNLERSIETALGQMGSRFAESLSGAAHQEFQSVIASLGGTAQLLEGMNVQFLTTQQTLSELVTFANRATTEQMALGKTQVEDFTTVLQGFMGQMHEATGLSVHQIGAALTTVVHDLSTQVAELGQQMTRTVVDSAGQAADVAQTVIEKADGWSARSAAQLAQLLDRQQGHLDRNQEVQRAFDVTLGQFKEALGQYNTVTGHLRQVAAAAAGITKAINETGVTVERTATMAALQAERFTEIVRRQEDIQQQVAQSMQQYQQVFSQATQATNDLLTSMEQHLHHYAGMTTQRFESVVQTAETHLAQAARRLGDTVDGLEAHLRGFTESLERLPRVGEAHGSPGR